MSERVPKDEHFFPSIVSYKDAKDFRENCAEDNFGDDCRECWYFGECKDCCEMEDYEKVFNDLKVYWRKKKLEKLLA